MGVVRIWAGWIKLVHLRRVQNFPPFQTLGQGHKFLFLCTIIYWMNGPMNERGPGP